jgi:hypothetical protein
MISTSRWGQYWEPMWGQSPAPKHIVHVLPDATYDPLRRGGHASASGHDGQGVTEEQGHPSPGPQHSTIRTDMPSRIVTTTYRYKRPPRKRKAVPLEGAAIVRSGRKREESSKPAAHPAPANDDGAPAPRPASAKTSAIVTSQRTIRWLMPGFAAGGLR